MKSIHTLTLCLLTATIALTTAAAFANDREKELEELQKRFKQRHEALERLQDQQKVGETVRGYVALVKQRYGGEEVYPKKKDSPTVKEFIAAENSDRKRLYELLAEKLEETPEDVAVQNAIRNFKDADPEHYLQLKDGSWIKKKDVGKKKD